MPKLPPRVCSKHHSIKIEKGKNCPLCTKDKNAKARARGKMQRAIKPRFYDSRLWRDRVRPYKLSIRPLCEECEKKGLIVPATEVDHKLSIAKGGDPVDLSNLRSLCKSCHSSKTAREDRGN